MAIFRGLRGSLYRKFLHKFYLNDLWLDLAIAAKRESVDYIRAHMLGAQVLRDRYDLLRFALAAAPVEGAVLEFGVEKGLSINCLARATPRTVHGFDSFRGLPQGWAGTKEGGGAFDRRGRLPRVAPNVRLHVGWFNETLPAFLAEERGAAALVHIDCDIYESTRVVFALLSPRIVPGTVIVFDEYFNYPGWQQHEFRAFQDFVARERRRYEYIGFSAERGHVAVRMLAARGATAV
jgi:predicted O-methyltransferase YrrM